MAVLSIEPCGFCLPMSLVEGLIWDFVTIIIFKSYNSLYMGAEIGMLAVYRYWVLGQKRNQTLALARAKDELVPSVLGRYGCATQSYDDSVVLILSRPGGLTRNSPEWTRLGHLLCDCVVLNSVLMRFS